MKKKLLAFLLLLALLTSCLPTALAAEVMLSTQNLKVNGVPIRCEKYNIDGSNYFKLRDLAYLLNGTGSQFALDYDPELKRVLITRGKGYVPDGSELLFSGEDRSSLAVPSRQTIYVDGQETSDLSVYNIGGNNYFQLRELSGLLGFGVEYDAATRTALVFSAETSVRRELTPEQIYATCAPAVFYVEIYDEDGWCAKTGSGFFLSPDGLAVTNYHVISGADSASVTVSDTGAVYPVLGVYDYSVEEDWAVIQVDGRGFQTLEIGDPSYDVGGATVYAIGSPLGLQNTISQGIISNPARLDGSVSYIQMSAAISPGSSGGALLNKYGQVIGITSATYSEGQNLNLAIPMTYLDSFRAEECQPLHDSRNEPGGTLTLFDNSLTLSLGTEGTVTAMAVERNCSGVSVRYSIRDESIVSCAWNPWYGDYVDLTVTPLSVGTTEITIYFIISGTDQVLDSKSLQVTVTGSGESVTDHPVYFTLSTEQLTASLFESVYIDVYACYPEDNDNTYISWYASDPSVVECSWGEWDGDDIRLQIDPLRAGSTEIFIVYCTEDGRELASGSVDLTVLYGLVTADAESISLAPGESVTVEASCFTQGVDWYYLSADTSVAGIVSLEWGAWRENGTDCPLTITGLAPGSTEAELYLYDSDSGYCLDSLLLPIRVS